jgi:hypothetical protein
VGSLALVVSGLSPGLARALAVDQIDTFESGTTEGWTAAGGPNSGVPGVPPAVETTGGPAGAEDAYLVVTATGGVSAGSRLVARNSSQWAGDYTEAGVAAITLDLINLGAADLQIRLFLENPYLAGPVPLPPSDTAMTTANVIVPAGSGWASFSIPVRADDLAVLTGSADVLLSGVTALRILHAPTATYPPPAVTAQLGMDNVRAVPEVASRGAAAIVLALLARRRRR